MSQGELASEAGVALSVLQAIEQNRSDPKLSTVLALLDVLKSKGVELLVEADHVAFGLFVTTGSAADLTGSIRPIAVQPATSADDRNALGPTSNSTRGRRSGVGNPKPSSKCLSGKFMRDCIVF